MKNGMAISPQINAVFSNCKFNLSINGSYLFNNYTNYALLTSKKNSGHIFPAKNPSCFKISFSIFILTFPISKSWSGDSIFNTKK